MKRLTSLAVAVAGASFLSLFVASLWMRGWMYRGWIGSPDLLGSFLEADGEARTDAVFTEMQIISFVLLLVPLRFLQRRANAEWTRRAAFAAFALALLPFVVILLDALYVGVLASPEVVAEFHFGSESMISHGGWGYQSRGHYGLSGALVAMPFGILAALCWYEGRRITSP